MERDVDPQGRGGTWLVVTVLAAACFSDPAPVGEGSTSDDVSGSSGEPDGTSMGGSLPTTTTTTDDGTDAGPTATSSDDTNDTTEGPPTGGPMRQPIVLDTMSSEALSHVPVLLRLSPEDVDYPAIAPGGDDLRFFADDGTPLAYELEGWNPGGVTNVWVRLQMVQPMRPTEIAMGYGDPAAIPAPPPHEVWSEGYLAVWHLPSLEDATNNGHALDVQAGESPPMEVSGPFGPALTFPPGTASLIANDSDDALELAGEGTVEAWVATQVAVSAAGGQHRIAVDKWPNFRMATISGAATNTRPLFLATVDGSNLLAQPPDALEIDEWTRLAGTAHVQSNMLIWCIHVPGSAAACDSGAATATDASNDFVSVGGPNLASHIDEVRISQVARSPAWLAVQARATNPEFATFLPPVARP